MIFLTRNYQTFHQKLPEIARPISLNSELKPSNIFEEVFEDFKNIFEDFEDILNAELKPNDIFEEVFKHFEDIFEEDKAKSID